MRTIYPLKKYLKHELHFFWHQIRVLPPVRRGATQFACGMRQFAPPAARDKKAAVGRPHSVGGPPGEGYEFYAKKKRIVGHSGGRGRNAREFLVK